jgi:hypothetical protein
MSLQSTADAMTESHVDYMPAPYYGHAQLVPANAMEVRGLSQRPERVPTAEVGILIEVTADRAALEGMIPS